MLYTVSFEEIYHLVRRWKWSELKFGLERQFVTERDIISYAFKTLDDNTEQFDTVLEMSLADVEEVPRLLGELVDNEKNEDENSVMQKWAFAIIYHAYSYSKEKVFNIIDDVYSDFNYPKELSNMIRYMPYDGGGTMDEKLDRYIATSRETWC